MATEWTVVGLYDDVATFLNIFQTAAVLEVSFVWFDSTVKSV